MRRNLWWVGAYAVAMALVEAAVVAYLKKLHPASDPLEALRTVATAPIIRVELAREAATIVMLVTVAVLAGRDAWQRFLYFAFAFGVWDIFYYVWLWVFERWPSSLLTWDVLFLIPVVWLAPVLAPVLVSAGLIAGAVWLLVIAESHPTHRPTWSAWALAGLGVVLILLSFTLDSLGATPSAYPASFRWWLFLSGMALGASAVVATARQARG